MSNYGHFRQILAPMTIPAHRIWSCQVTQNANFENLLFCPSSTLILGKVAKFLVEKLSISEVISKKPRRDKGVTPVPLGLNLYTFFDSHGIWFQSNISLFQAISSPHEVIFKHYGLN